MKNNNINILLTGATGFLGSHLLKYFIENSNYNFVVLKRASSNLQKIKNLSKNKRIIYFDIDKNLENIQEIFHQQNIKAIIHCATNYGRNNTSCAEVLESNLIFPIRLLETAIKNNVEIFINTDSYFNKANMSYMHLQNYSLSKKSLNLWLKYFSNKIKIINIILEHIYGENDSLEKFTSLAINNIALRKIDKIELTNGEQKRDFVYIDDVVSAYDYILNFALNNKVKYKDFNLGTGNSLSIKDFVKMVKKVSNSRTILNFGKIAYREDEIMNSVADNCELLNLGWKPKYSLEKGIRKYIQNEQIIINSNTNLQ